MNMLQTLEFLLYSKIFWVTAIFAVFYAYLEFFVYAYWKKQGVPHDRPIIPFGNILPVFLQQMSMGNFLKENYEKFKKHRFHGIYVFNRPVLVINDAKLIHQILTTEFDKFNGRGVFCNENIDPLSITLFNLSGERSKKLKMKLTPSLTSSKLKEMFPLFKEISASLIETCNRTLAGSDVVEIKDLMARFTSAAISSIAYGFNCGSLKDANSEFKRYGHMVFNRPPIKNLILAYAPVIFDLLHIPFYRKDMIHFFLKTFEDAVKRRRLSSTFRKDFLNLLIQLMDHQTLENDGDGESDVAADKKNISKSEACAQAFAFYAAGFETTSSTMTYLLYELALNPEIQERVHEEINKSLSKGKVTYSKIQSEFKYLDMILSETMRKHPAFPALNRLCNTDWKIPDANFTVKKGTAVIIPVYGLHHDADIYFDPEKFDPNRFLYVDKSAQSFRSYLPFGDGPKNCIGSRIAVLKMKLALVNLLANYKFSKCERTIIPIQYSKRSFTHTPACDVYLRLEKRI